MKHLNYYRWGIFVGAVLLGVLFAQFAGASARFTFAAFVAGGILAAMLFDSFGERLLYGAALAAEFKEARGLVREARRLMRRGRGRLSPHVIDELAALCRQCTSAIDAGDRTSLGRLARSLTNSADAHLTQFRKTPWREYFEPIAVAALVALTLRGFVFEAFEIPSGSMIPTLYVGDKIFVNKVAYGIRVPIIGWRIVDYNLPRRGEIIVFRYPRDPSENFVKRVVGLPGDTFEMRDGVVYINGEAVSKRLMGPVHLWDKQRNGDWFEGAYSLFSEQVDSRAHSVISDPDNERLYYPATRIPEGYLWVLGDNRDHSSDSREWGMVPLQNLVGRAMFIWWSWGPSLNTERFFHWVE